MNSTNTATATLTVSFSIPTATTPVTVPVEPGKPVFLLGQNGSGKSALVHLIFTSLGSSAVYFPGSRPSYFEGESLSITPASRRSLTSNFRSWDSSPDARWRVVSGSSRNEKAIHDLQAAELQYKLDAANEIKRDGPTSSAIARLQSDASPVDRVNALLAQANLPVRVVIEGAELKAKRSGKTYSIAKMSDGERSALILAADVVASPNASIFLIDEPEQHLHRAIVVPLIASLIAERPTCSFVVSTHELDLASESPSATVILVRGSNWSGDSIASWDVDVLASTDEIPEWIRVDLLGSRRKILFVEGVRSSLDQPLYALLFPSVSVRARESCREVERAVAGLRAVEQLHRAEAFGLVDHDAMGQEQLVQLQAENIFPLSVFAVESLYYSAPVLEAVAAQQAGTLGVSAGQLLADARGQAMGALHAVSTIEHLAARVSERQMRDRLLLAMPDRQELTSEAGESIAVSILSPYPAELQRITDHRNKAELAEIIARYPVRESGVLTALAKGLRFLSRTDYERAALTRIGSDEGLKATLREALGAIGVRLE